jgi:hypothetical protein
MRRRRALKNADAEAFVQRYAELPLTYDQLRYMHDHLWRLRGRSTTALLPAVRLWTFGESSREMVDEFTHVCDRVHVAFRSPAFDDIDSVDDLVRLVAALPLHRTGGRWDGSLR